MVRKALILLSDLLLVLTLLRPELGYIRRWALEPTNYPTFANWKIIHNFELSFMLLV